MWTVSTGRWPLYVINTLIVYRRPSFQMELLCVEYAHLVKKPGVFLNVRLELNEKIRKKKYGNHRLYYTAVQQQKYSRKVSGSCPFDVRLQF